MKIAVRLFLIVGLLFHSACSNVLSKNFEIKQVSYSDAGAFEAEVVHMGGRTAVAWYDNRSGSANIYLKVLSKESDSKGINTQTVAITDSQSDAFEVSLSTAHNQLFLAWYEKTGEGSLAQYDAQLAVTDLSGQILWQQSLGKNTKNPVVVASDDRVLVSWLQYKSETGFQSPEVYAGWWSDSGEILVEPFRVGSAGSRTWNLNAELAYNSNGEVKGLVVYDRVVEGVDELFLAEIEGESVSLQQISINDGYASKYPDLNVSDNRRHYALSWHDMKDGNNEIYLVTGELKAIGTLSIDQQARRITQTEGSSIGAYLAWQEDEIGLVWCDEMDSVYQIFFQKFTEEGVAASSIIQITENSSASLIPSIYPVASGQRSGFEIVWNELDKPELHGHSRSNRSEVFMTTID